MSQHRAATHPGVCETGQASTKRTFPENNWSQCEWQSRLVDETSERGLGSQREIHNQGQECSVVQTSTGIGTGSSVGSRGIQGSHQERSRGRGVIREPSPHLGEVSTSRESSEREFPQSEYAGISKRTSHRALGRRWHWEDEEAIRGGCLPIRRLREWLVGRIRGRVRDLLGRLLRGNQIRFLVEIARWISMQIEGERGLHLCTVV